MEKITDAVILMAGTGSRFNGTEVELPKPLIAIAGRPLISYTIDSLANAGVTTLYLIVGAKADLLVGEIENLVPRHVAVKAIHNPQWRKQNGVSLLCAAGFVSAPFYITMGDHLFEASVFDQLMARSDGEDLNVAVDRKIDSIFDLDDAMKVETKDGRIRAIGKNLSKYDAIDTGLFVSPPEFFEYLERAKKDEDCSLADGVRLMAAADKVNAVDIGHAWWQDVDTPEMRTRAEAGVHALWAGRSRLSAGG